MKQDFWQTRWDAKQIGFHEGKPNDLLIAHADEFPPKSRILVPLAGKAVDLVWLGECGHEVVGVEFVQAAVDEFAATKPPPNVTMILGDMFAMTPERIGTFDAIYDRAALVALEPSTRERYIEVCRTLSKPNAVTVLVTFAYDQTKAPGPPFSIDEPTVRTLYASRTIQRLQTRVPAGLSARLRESGVDSVEESIYRIV